MVDLTRLLTGPLYKLYSWRLWKQVKNGRKPGHVGVILDGNRRFAREKGLNVWVGHHMGAEKVREFLSWCWEVGIKIVTLYAFSIENFKRRRREIEEIMRLAKSKFEEVLTDKNIHKYKVKVQAIGRKNMLPKELQEIVSEIEQKTKDYSEHFLNVAIGYGGRAEIVDAFRSIADRVSQGTIKPEEVNESLIEKYLYTAGLPDPDLIIRTSGEERLSGFLLWQSAYSELYFCEMYWPALRKIDFWRAIRTYQQRVRRFGS
ncbi:MAG: polyprenyl diphosphate synthase [Candidatus Hodarchaeota archaeon]